MKPPQSVVVGFIEIVEQNGDPIGVLGQSELWDLLRLVRTIHTIPTIGHVHSDTLLLLFGFCVAESLEGVSDTDDRAPVECWFVLNWALDNSTNLPLFSPGDY